MLCNPNKPSKLSILKLSPTTKNTPMAMWTSNFLLAPMPMMSSLRPMKKMGIPAPKTPIHWVI